ncbi:MAG: FlgD immunoglobulin-like domain containing protein [bacterium]
MFFSVSIATVRIPLVLLLLFLVAWVAGAGVGQTLLAQTPEPVISLAGGAPGELPTAWIQSVRALDTVARVQTPALDLEAIREEDERREWQGLPYRFAIPNPVAVTPETDGTWEQLADGSRLWRLRVLTPGSRSVNFGFSRYRLSPGAKLTIYATAGSGLPYCFTAADNEAHGQLWTPVVLAADVMLELTLPPAGGHRYELELTAINAGYRFFGENGFDKSGACNIDVVCPEGDEWRDEIRSVGMFTLQGSWKCTGFLVNNTTLDETPYFLTADHCDIIPLNAQTMVIYWNFESPNCGDQGGGLLDDTQSGALFRASNSFSDFTLVELEDDPSASFRVTFAGWDRSENDPTSAACIHHPGLDEKSISFENDPCVTTSWSNQTVPGDGSHIMVSDWDLGTTEGGSSGSPLFDQNHRVVGQLHGGFAGCGNNEADWYGRFSTSWGESGADSSACLRYWLDPLATGITSLEILVPDSAGFRLLPFTSFEAGGDVGGPFAPRYTIYSLGNMGLSTFDYLVESEKDWLHLSPASGSIAGAQTVEVQISVTAAASSVPEGIHTATITFRNTTNQIGDTSRQVKLKVGYPRVVRRFSLDEDPGWSLESDWEFGRPTGQGGTFGYPDPTSGYSGRNVFGNNLDGDYSFDTSARHLTSKAIDCSNLSDVTVKFWRWLGVNSPQIAEASFSVSSDGVEFTPVWTNLERITDAVWTAQEFNIAVLADGEPTVYLRWTLGPTSGSGQFCGWNLDDITVWALTPGGGNQSGEGRVAMLLAYPNPFRFETIFTCRLLRAGEMKLAIYDLRGRLVRTLVDGSRDVGTYTETWLGDDDAGRYVSSGTYICRLEADGDVGEQKVVWLR